MTELDDDALDRAAALAALPDPPVEDPAAKTAGRPTTRAGRRAAAAAKGDKAPRSTGSSSRPSGPTAKHIAQSVAGLHELAGGLVTMTGRPITGAMLTGTADEAGEAIAALSLRYPAVARMFTGTGDAMLFVKVLLIYAPIVQTALAEPRSDTDAAAASALFGMLGAQAQAQPAA